MTGGLNSLNLDTQKTQIENVDSINRGTLHTALDTGIVNVYERVNERYSRSVTRIVADALSIEEPQTARYVAHMVEPSIRDMRDQLLLAAQEAAEDMRSVARQARVRLDNVNNY